MNNSVQPNSNNVNTNQEQPSVQGVVSNESVLVNSVSKPVTNSQPGNTNQGSVSVPQQVTQNVNNVSNGQTQVPVANNLQQSQVATGGGQSKPPSKFKYVMVVLLFVGLLALVWFLPEISNYISIMRTERANPVEVITTGDLKCAYSRTSENLDFSYTRVFSYTDSKLDKMIYTIETRGDQNLDAVVLDEMDQKCKLLSGAAKDLDGISVTCSLLQGTMVEKQTLTYAEMDVDQVTTAYIEAGGDYPQYQNQQSIDEIEQEMRAIGYTCERIR